MIIIATFSYVTLQSTEEARNRVTRGVDTLSQLQLLLTTLQDAETGQRGFLLTGDEGYLEPYNDSTRAALPAIMAATRALVANDTEQLQRLETISQLSTQKLDELQRTIDLRRAGDTNEAMTIVRNNLGKLLMDRSRALVDDISEAERTALAESEAQRSIASARSVQVTLIGSATSSSSFCSRAR